jgi:hypothetical protein
MKDNPPSFSRSNPNAVRNRNGRRGQDHLEAVLELALRVEQEHILGASADVDGKDLHREARRSAINDRLTPMSLQGQWVSLATSWADGVDGLSLLQHPLPWTAQSMRSKESDPVEAGADEPLCAARASASTSATG